MERIWRGLKLGMKSLLLHKLRSGLTVLGIVFGVAAVISMLAVGEGSSRDAQERIQQLGATNIIIRSVKPSDESQNSGGRPARILNYGLKYEDFDRVVATVPTLGGQEIEPYANELFRIWKLGEKVKNNGVLLIVAPNERKVRIEVGYGLEGTLTDALSKIVISNAIAPRFKAGDFGGGVQRGVDDIITILTTDSAEWQARPKVREEQSLFDQLLPFLLIALVIFIIWRSWRGPARRGPGGKTTSGSSTWFPSGGSSWSSGGGGSSWGDSGGGFSGGGGSSGGGGASGGW